MISSAFADFGFDDEEPSKGSIDKTREETIPPSPSQDGSYQGKELDVFFEQRCVITTAMQLIFTE